MSNNQEKKTEQTSRYLVLFSGGKDSFITTCRLANKGHSVTLLSINGGALACEKHLTHGVKRLIRRYGKDKIEYAGIYPTTGVLQVINKNWIYKTQKELGEEYPNLTNCQWQCLHCQTSMWISAIAYANAKGIHDIASGCKESDIFCTGITEYLDRIKELASEFDCTIHFPVWELGEDVWVREQEMMRNHFMPQVLEPKCLIGRPPLNGLQEPERLDMIKYYDDSLKDISKQEVKKLIPIFRVIRLSDTTFKPFEYPDTYKPGDYI